jgi:N-acetylmuramoyl-L-alanine amidase CwlA
MVALNYEKKHIKLNPYSRSGDKLIKLQAVVIHYTANPGGDADMHYRYFNGLKGRYAGAHIFVDKDKALEIIPLDEVAYHANERNPKLSTLNASTSYYPKGNANLLTVGIEMCLEPNGELHPDTIERTRLVVKYLQSMYSQLSDTKNRIIRHYDVTGKNCPKPFVEDEQKWNAFLYSIDQPIKESVKVAAANKDDVKGHWAEKSINKAKKKGVINGHSDGSFGPNEPVTRGQLAVILDRLGLLD